MQFCLNLFIHAQKSGGELSIRAELTRLSVCARFRCVCVRFRCVCVRFRCVCVRFRCVCLRALQCAENFSHSARLQQSRAFYMLASCFRAVLILSPDTWDWTRMHTLMVMHRRTLYENVDSAKIKVPFILQISIFYAWHWCIVSSYIVSIYRWIVTPLLMTHGPFYRCYYYVSVSWS